MLGSGGTKEGLVGVGCLQHDQLIGLSVRDLRKDYRYSQSMYFGIIIEKQTGIRIYKHCTYSFDY